jgi:putative ABC transport system substrate-binding protein
MASQSNGGLIILASPLAQVHQEMIVKLAAQHRLPAVYPWRYFVASGGLMSYGADPIEVFRRSALYIDRILKGERPADLPVQQPTKFELAINLKTAEAILNLAVSVVGIVRWPLYQARFRGCIDSLGASQR